MSRADDMFAMVRHALESGRPANAYLIVGALRGSAMTFARQVLQLLFCTAKKKPCGVCDACRHVCERAVPDVHWILPEKKSRVISVENIHENLLAPISVTASAGGWKAGVLVGADRLNEASANAFLKTLEEPPANTLFLLLTDAPQQLLPTIISRCQRIDLPLEDLLTEPWRSRVLDILASPHMGRPIEKMAAANQLFDVLQQLNAHAKEEIDTAGTDDSTEETKDEYLARVSARYRELRGALVSSVLAWYRDLLVWRAAGEAVPLSCATFSEAIVARAGRLPLDWILYDIHAVEDFARQLERAMPEEMAVGYLIDRLHHGTEDEPCRQ